MRLWQRLAGALKDRNSVWVAQLSRRTSFRNPDLEAAIIKATSHDQHRIDCKNVQRVFQWIRTSPLYLRPLVWALAMRMQKTRSWVVALKGLMLMHGIYCCNIAVIQNMGRLPFDLSNFSDEHANPDRARNPPLYPWNFRDRANRAKKTEDTLMEELEKLQAMQDLIDMLLKIKPEYLNLQKALILEAMDCVIVELFDVYSKFCKGIARALLRIYDIGGKTEASVGLKVLRKAAIQSGQLSAYFDFCREIGVLNASQCPKMERFPEGYIQDLERIINGADEKESLKSDKDEGKAMVFNVNAIACKDERKGSDGMKTVITKKWEVFDDEMVLHDGAKATFSTNPFEESYCIVPYQAVHKQKSVDRKVPRSDLQFHVCSRVSGVFSSALVFSVGVRDVPDMEFPS
ncbi:putative clathrin assembly protein At1g25240 [Prosopis cineraria]|uniref:putative clathrin assembly protein At1g25240 n=1 Tax=Prosopis cineraria TaxID=364024 RepID=UPI00240EE746|nr:putative clathrin assembly protein At1g25240 [Prosopis cineraria]